MTLCQPVDLCIEPRNGSNMVVSEEFRWAEKQGLYSSRCVVCVTKPNIPYPHYHFPTVLLLYTFSSHLACPTCRYSTVMSSVKDNCQFLSTVSKSADIGNAVMGWRSRLTHDTWKIWLKHTARILWPWTSDCKADMAHPPLRRHFPVSDKMDFAIKHDTCGIL